MKYMLVGKTYINEIPVRIVSSIICSCGLKNVWVNKKTD